MPIATGQLPGNLVTKPHNRKWWKSATVYQIYPASFKDGNGDGIGDIPGIISKLDYLKDLGVDVLWLSPIFASPLVDMGYDISDYKKVDSRYGTNSDVTTLIEELHKRGMKLLLDLVVNHTSDQALPFVESAAATPGSTSEQGSKRDWYIWKRGSVNENGERVPPNNWGAAFGGSVWEWHEPSQEYYLHYFCPEQPDLNWENPLVREFVWDVMRFWLDQGVDGFRMDVINMISKHLDYPDVEVTRPDLKWQPAGHMMCNGPKMHDYLKEMNEQVISKYDMMNVGEMPCTLDAKTVMEYVHEDRNELQMIFDFVLVDLDLSRGESYKPRKWDLWELKKIVSDWATGLYDGGWAAFYLENHDQCRSTTRWTNDSAEFRWLSSKMLGLMEMTSFGTTYVYQGQEIGQINLPEDYPEAEYKDVQTINRVAGIRARGGSNVEQEVKYALSRGRDHARSPMQWSSGPAAGFGSYKGDARPWMLPSPDHKICNATDQAKDKTSVLSWYKRLIALRKEMEVLIYGRFHLLSALHEDVFAYTRTIIKAGTADEEESVLVILNFRERDVTYEIPDEVEDSGKAQYVIGSYEATEDYVQPQIKEGVVTLRPYEGLLFRL